MSRSSTTLIDDLSSPAHYKRSALADPAEYNDRDTKRSRRSDHPDDRASSRPRRDDDRPPRSEHRSTAAPRGDPDTRSSRRADPYYDDDPRHSSSRRYDPYYDEPRRSRRPDPYDDYDSRGRRSNTRQDSSAGDLGKDKGFGFSFGGAHHLGRYRSPSPPPGTVPLNKRPRQFTKWDIIPQGYESVPAMEAKASNNFLLPCHKAVMKLQPGHLVGQPGIPRALGYPIVPIAPGSTSFQARTARRLYFGNIPRDVSDADLLNFVNQQMQAIGYEPSAMSASFGGDRSFAFIEFREADHASTMLQYDGQWQFGGLTLRIKRPRDYVPNPGEEHSATNHMSNGASNASSNPDKLFIGGIPRNLTEIQVRELLEAFGSVQSFNLIMDSEKGESKGYAFCEYADGATADVAIEGLNGMEIGERKLVVQRASIGPKTAAPPLPPPETGPEPSDGPPDGILIPALQAANGMGAISKVMVLLNLASPDDVRQPHSFKELLNDVRRECLQHGRLEDIFIPQIPDPVGKSGDGPHAQPVVQVFAIFSDEFECQNALRNICGRTYRGRTIVAAFFPEARWSANDYYGAQAALAPASTGMPQVVDMDVKPEPIDLQTEVKTDVIPESMHMDTLPDATSSALEKPSDI